MLSQFIIETKLPSSFASTARQWFVPVVSQITKLTTNKTTPVFIGINGCQGSGKSTLAAFLCHQLNEEHGLSVVNLSLDDFYYSREKRAELAETIHPLLATRGVPGTHNTELLGYTLACLEQNQTVAIPSFDKAQDNPVPSCQWQSSPAKVDVVLMEGWCWGVKPQNIKALDKPINELEKLQDTGGKWRQYVNQQLACAYQPLYSIIDKWLMLKAPSFSCVHQWRWQQEQRLAENSDLSASNQIMTEAQVTEFIAYFQRLTEHALATLEKDCDLVFYLDQQRKVQSAVGRL
ncbi:kinase [Colwellia sp. MEBiC06753]